MRKKHLQGKVCVSVSLSFRLCVCLSVCLSLRLCVCLSVSLSLSLSFRLCPLLSISLFLPLSLCDSLLLSNPSCLISLGMWRSLALLLCGFSALVQGRFILCFCCVWLVCYD